MPPIAELAKAVREKYPGDYDDVDDLELANAWKEKYPGDYDDYTEGVKGKKKIPAKGAGAKALEVGMEIFGRPADVVTTLAAKVAGKLPLGKEAKANLKKVEESPELSLGSEVIQELLPFLKAPKQRVPTREEMVRQQQALAQARKGPRKNIFEQVLEMGKGIIPSPEGALEVAKAGGRVTGRLAADLAMDPYMYLGILSPTKLGRARVALEEARFAGQPVKLESKLAKIIAKEEGFTRPSAAAIQKFSRTKPSKTTSGRIAAGEQSLFSFGPFQAKGKLASKVVKPFEALGKTKAIAKINQITRDAFKVSTGHHDYDVLYFKYRNAALHKAGIAIEDAKVLNNDIRDLAKARGVTPEVVHKELNQLVEQVLPRSKKYSKQAYGAAVHQALELHYTDKLVDAKVNLARLNKLLGKESIKNTAFRTPEGKILTSQFPKTHGDLLLEYPELLQGKDDILGEVGFITDKGRFLNRTQGEMNRDFSFSTGEDFLRIRKEQALAQKEVANFQGAINEITGKYTPVRGLDPRAEKIARDIKNTQENQRLAERAAGLPAPELLADIGYLTHATLPETQASLRNKWITEGKLPPKASSKEFNTEVQNYLTRQFSEIKPSVIDAWEAVGLISKRQAKSIKGKDGVAKLYNMLQDERITTGQFTNAVHTLSLDDIRALPRDVKERIFGAGVPDEVFHTDPVYYTTIRNIRGQRAITSAEFFNELKVRGIAVPEKTAPANWSNVRQSELNGFKVPPEVARGLNKWREFQLNPKDVSQALATYDKFHTLTKAWTLAIFPAYHSKNMMGNFWNNWLAGVSNPLVYNQADKVLRNKKLEITDIFGKKWTSSELKTEMSKLGVIGRGQFNQELTRTIAQNLESGKFFTLSSRSKVLRAGRQVGQFVEDNARAAHFIDRLKKGDTAEQAALSVKKYLFDYGELTDLERQVLNRIFFFYKWTKENLPLQLHSMVTTPWKFGVPFKAKAEIEKEVPQPDERYLYEYFKDNFPVRVRYNDRIGKYEYFMLNSWLPAADLLKLNQLHDIGLQMLAPLPKGLIEWLWNYNLYFKKKIERTKGQKDKFLGIDLPAKITNAAKVIRLLNEIDKMSSKDRDLMSKLTDFMGGKTYSFDPQEGKVANYYKVKDEVEQLMSELYKVERKKPVNAAEKQRIIQLIQDKNKEY